MPASTSVSGPGAPLPIGVVERETGLSKDVLRKWETRYGFPKPERDATGERIYPPDQVARLGLIKRLLDSGMRPSHVVGKTPEVLAELAEQRRPKSTLTDPDGIGEGFLEALRAQDAPALRQSLNRLLREDGVRLFVQDKLAALTRLIGEAWARSELGIHEEHLFSEIVQNMLRRVIDELNDPLGRPRILMTTLPGEPHGLGLLMVAALASLETASCLSLGTQTPLQEIRSAAEVRVTDIVALSFSANFPARAVTAALAQLRSMLPEHVEVWAGGEGALRLVAREPGIVIVDSLAAIPGAIARGIDNHMPISAESASR
jgi:MerR family transcriptional regulator, light-induced transcriptional regulator